MPKKSSQKSGAAAAPKIKPNLDSPEAFSKWLRGATGIDIKIASEAVCPGHTSPWEIFRTIFLERPSLALVLGGRGTGKSYLSALDTHLTSLVSEGHGTRVLGGSRSQSEQIYRALREFAAQWPAEKEKEAVEKLTKAEATYVNGSEVTVLAASSTSVRGPHVPTLKLDEVDEIKPEHFESAMGMCMNRRGSKASTVMTSTWHRHGGLMSQLVDRARDGEFPLYTMCVFEVLERCPDSRSGKLREKCPDCPLVQYCHDVPEGTAPKAKRSNGHYGIDSLIQKLRTTSTRTFEADYLCRGPKADGLWFPGFAHETHVTDSAEFDPALPVHIAIDSGVFTGAVFFQVTPDHTGTGEHERVHVFADYLTEGHSAEVNAKAIRAMARQRCNDRLDRVSTDPAGGSRTAIGPTVIAEYERAGLNRLDRWPIGSVADGLSLIESFVLPAEGPPKLLIHPRCVATIKAFQSYRRAKRQGQWQDSPQDPQHPSEEMIDSLRGGLRLVFPEGRVRSSGFRFVPGKSTF